LKIKAIYQEYTIGNEDNIPGTHT